MQLKKVYIIGTVGSGKSFLAKKLSNIFKIKHYDLMISSGRENITKNAVKRKELKCLLAYAIRKNGFLKEYIPLGLKKA